jgi:hypothetical protein
MVNVLGGFRYYLEEYFGEILFLLGVILFFISVGALSTFGTVLSAGCFFFGVLLVFFGLFARLGVFSVKFRSLDGVSVILICCSIVLLAFSVAVLEFLTTNVGVDVFIFRYKIYYMLTFNSERPYVWVSGVCMLFGFLFLVFGLALKVYSILRY